MGGTRLGVLEGNGGIEGPRRKGPGGRLSFTGGWGGGGTHTTLRSIEEGVGLESWGGH